MKLKLVKRDKGVCHILIKGTIWQEDIMIINLYTQNGGSPNFIKETLFGSKSQICLDTITLNDFNIPLSSIAYLNKKQQRNFGVKLHQDWKNLTDIQIFHSTTVECIFLLYKYWMKCLWIVSGSLKKLGRKIKNS